MHHRMQSATELDMEHTASTDRSALWSTWPRCCLLLATLAGCGTSNAVITGLPVGGQTGPAGTATGASSIIGAGPTSQPPAPPVSSGVGGSVVPSLGVASAGAPSAMPTTTAGASSTAVAQTGIPSLPSGASGCRQAQYSLAIRLTVDMGWDETVALMAGAGKIYFWSKLTIEPGASAVSEFRACGSLPPVYRSTAVAGNITAFQRVPLATYDLPTMPIVAGGSATRLDSALTLLPGSLLMGLSLPDPAGPWPLSPTDPSVMPVDADGDGKPGITSLMRNDATFTGSPTSILQTERIDATYVASRLAFRTTAGRKSSRSSRKTGRGSSLVPLRSSTRLLFRSLRAVRR
jgi:hypothetical protein